MAKILYTFKKSMAKILYTFKKSMAKILYTFLKIADYSSNNISAIAE